MTPMAAPAAFMSRGGQGHYMRGIWPPTDVPVEVWNVADLYQTCGWTPEQGGFLPTQVAEEDAWTMDAFHCLKVADSQIRNAIAKKEMEIR